MNTRTIVSHIQRATLAGIAFAAIVIGGPLATQATATPHVAPPGTTAPIAPPAIPGVPDVGQPGEGAGPQLVPTIDPHGSPVWPTENDGTTTPDGMVRSGWTEVVAIVDGARIRTKPVTGTVVGLIPKRTYFYISCQARASDGYIWGYAKHAGRYGWVRKDLWEVVYYTAPGAPAPRPIPWC